MYTYTYTLCIDIKYTHLGSYNRTKKAGAVATIYLINCVLALPTKFPSSQLCAIDLSHINHPAVGSQTIPSRGLPKGGQTSPGAEAPFQVLLEPSPRASWTGSFSAPISLDQDVWAAAWRDFKKHNFGLIKYKSTSHVSIPQCSEQNLPSLHGGQA